MKKLLDENPSVAVTMAQGDDIAHALGGPVPSYIDQVRNREPSNFLVL